MTGQRDLPENEIQKILYQHGAIHIREASSKELYRAVSYYIREIIGKQMYDTWKRSKESRVMVYMSMEYLPGSLLQKNIDYLNIGRSLEESLQRCGCKLEDLLKEDRQLGLGNSDLGHLSNGLMDTFASGSYNAIGYGLLYREGYFRQEIVDGQQVESHDNWWLRGKNWLYKGDYSYKVVTGGKVDISMGEKGFVFTQRDTEDLLLRYYDLPYLGYENNTCNRLRLFDHKNLTRKVHGIDSIPDERRERFKQEYLLVSGALQDVVMTHLENKREIESLNDHFLFLMTDTNLLLAIPELMRILLDNHKMEWDLAWEITSKAFFYTPFTPLENTLTTLEGSMLKEWLPRLWMILEEIHHRYLSKLEKIENLGDEGKKTSGILWDDQVRLYNISNVGVHKGPPISHPLAISHRRWLISGNPPLRDLMKEYLGEDFFSRPEDIKGIVDFESSKAFLDKLEGVKQKNKNRLRNQIFGTQGILINPHSIFHGYLKDFKSQNRQLLILLWILDTYLDLKDNPNLDMVPRTIFIGGKAAAQDNHGKLLIRLANHLSREINGDKTIKEKLKVLFVEDLSLKKAEFLYPALDITHSLTTPTKGGVHLAGLTAMINGAVAIGSREETNLLLKEHVGEDNIYLFGITCENAEKCYDTKEYSSHEHYYRNRELRRCVDALVGREGIIPKGVYKELQDELLKYNDNNFILGDFEEFKEEIAKAERDYLDQEIWIKKALRNIALTGDFASDAVVARYARIMWKSSK